MLMNYQVIAEDEFLIFPLLLFMQKGTNDENLIPMKSYSKTPRLFDFESADTKIIDQENVS
jgi:hypothetical protein